MWKVDCPCPCCLSDRGCKPVQWPSPRSRAHEGVDPPASETALHSPVAGLSLASDNAV